MQRYEVRVLHSCSPLESVFHVEARGPAAAATEAFMVSAGGRAPEVVEAINVAGNPPGEHRFRLSLHGEPAVDMAVRLVHE